MILKKGILLSGRVGCGKTSLMKLLRYITPHYKAYEVIHARNVTFALNHIGYSIIEQYGNQYFYCFDDLGIEPTGRFFGKDCNVMGEVLLSRHELFLKYQNTWNYKFKCSGTQRMLWDSSTVSHV